MGVREQAMNHHELIQAIAAECRRRGSQKALAQAWDISEQYLSDILNERREPGDLVLQKMGLRKVVTYEPQREQQS